MAGNGRANLDPDCLRVGADIVSATTFNGNIPLTGGTVSEPSTMLLLGSRLIGLAGYGR